MPQEDRKKLSVQVVSIVGYLIGVKEEIFTREFKTTVYKTLETKPERKRSVLFVQSAQLS